MWSWSILITIVLAHSSYANQAPAGYRQYWGDARSETGLAHKLYEKCDINDASSCLPNLNCTDFSGLDKEIGSRCECHIPTSTDQCLCAISGAIYRRWIKMDNPKDIKYKNKAPKAGWEKPGCYLGSGEICQTIDHDDPNAPTHLICKVDHYCMKVEAGFGFCKYGKASTILISSLLLSFTITLPHLIQFLMPNCFI